ncbi:MAG: hypothetical protein AAF195_01330 [Pseudomonadota bacterium]
MAARAFRSGANRRNAKGSPSPVRGSEFDQHRKRISAEKINEKAAEMALDFASSVANSPEELARLSVQFHEDYFVNDAAFDYSLSPLFYEEYPLQPNKTKAWVNDRAGSNENSRAEFQRLIDSGKPINIKIPEHLKKHITEAEYWQIIKELTIANRALVDPYINLSPALNNNNIDSHGHAKTIVCLPAVLRNTMIGKAIAKADYELKIATHYPYTYFPEEITQDAQLVKEISDYVKKTRVNELGTDFDKIMERNIANYKNNGAKLLLEEYPELKHKYPKLWSKKASADVNKIHGASGSIQFASTNPTIYVDQRTGDVSCDAKTIIFSKPSGGYELQSNWYTKLLEELMFSGDIKHAAKDIAITQLVTILNPIIRTMCACGMQFDFSDTPDYQRYKTPTILPPILHGLYDSRYDNMISYMAVPGQERLYNDSSYIQTFGGFSTWVYDPDTGTPCLPQFEFKKGQAPANVSRIVRASSGGSMPPKQITGYTRHGLEQAMDREDVGVSPEAILKTFREGRGNLQGNGRFEYYHEGTTVILEPDGTLKTAYARGKKNPDGSRNDYRTDYSDPKQRDNHTRDVVDRARARKNRGNIK